MHRRTEPESIENVRLVSGQRGAEYAGMGLQSFKRWANQIGAVRRFGRIVRYDMAVVNAELDRMMEENSPTA